MAITDNPEPTIHTTVPPDEPNRTLTHARPEDPSLQHISIAGDTYTTLISGADTAGRYCLIDMLVPPGGGPPPHRHDFEEMFTILDGEVQSTFRGEDVTVRAGETMNIPANAPYFFHNLSGGTVRMLCMCSPAGQEQFFAATGDRVPDRNSPPPNLTDDEKAQRVARAKALAPQYRTELLI
jgi:mannose-6-phosphate isomerase-like protein (cupin superfamily)